VEREFHKKLLGATQRIGSPAVRRIIAATALAGLVVTSACQQQQTSGRIGRTDTSDTVPPPPTTVPLPETPPSPSPSVPSSTLPRDEPGSTATESAIRVMESAQYAEDEIVGVLYVTTSAAYFEGGTRRISLIQTSPVVAADAETLKAQAAQALRLFSDRHVRARGDLQGSILWDATVTASD